MAESLRALVEAVREARADYAFRRGSLDAARLHAVALATHLLTHPEAVEAVEVLRAWGEAKVAAIDSGSALFRAEHAYEYDGGPREAWEQAGNAHLVARGAETAAESAASRLAMKMALADRLAAKGGE